MRNQVRNHICFVDFKCAFDSVWRQALLYKLLLNDAGGSILKVLLSMHSDVGTVLKVSMA